MGRLATASLASGIAFGTISQVAARRGAGRLVPRRLHQASFVSSLVFLSLSAWSLRRTNRAAAATDAAAFLVLTTLPLTAAGRANHIGVASTAAALHGVAAIVCRPSPDGGPTSCVGNGVVRRVDR